MWVLGHIDSQRNEAAVRATKEAEPATGLIPFSNLKPLTSKYVCEVWQKEWDEADLVSNKFHEIYQGFQANFYLFVTQGRKTLFWTDYILVILIWHIYLFWEKKRFLFVLCVILYLQLNIYIEWMCWKSGKNIWNKSLCIHSFEM